ncbi:hypothetical protein [Stappia indica]|uniref:hypothetical protein n=1 Tax=Stappia indica TaxID=538381 RepID=UPI001303DF2F|nr:hypothetical protein [Stappia indica]
MSDHASQPRQVSDRLDFRGSPSLRLRASSFGLEIDLQDSRLGDGAEAHAEHEEVKVAPDAAPRSPMLFSFSGSTKLPAGKGGKSETTAKITAAPTHLCDDEALACQDPLSKLRCGHPIRGSV